MIYPHQQKAIDYIIDKFRKDDRVEALLLSGSIAHGFNDAKSDVDINIVVSQELYEQYKKNQAMTYWESAADFYEGGYFDGKYISLAYLSLVLDKGNEPTRFALGDSEILFDRTGRLDTMLKCIGRYDLAGIQERAIRFLSQFEAWKWYCEEAIKRNNQYLLDLSVSKMILFGARLILLDNQTFFPYHKWLMTVLENVPHKPEGLMSAIEALLAEKSQENINCLYDRIKNYKDWTNGSDYSWTSHFVYDVETVWMRQEEFIENI
jgi:hypothetical protein